MTDKARELAKKALERIGSEIGYYAVNERRVQQFIDIFTQTIQQALDEQAAEVVALREALDIYVQASKFTGFHRAGANPVVDHFQVNLSPDDHAKINIALTQPNPRAAQIMAVVQAAVQLVQKNQPHAVKDWTSEKECERALDFVPVDVWEPFIAAVKALEGGA
jgi:hypothetical protein